jgi:hypothetical protein
MKLFSLRLYAPAERAYAGSTGLLIEALEDVRDFGLHRDNVDLLSRGT